MGFEKNVNVGREREKEGNFTPDPKKYFFRKIYTFYIYVPKINKSITITRAIYKKNQCTSVVFSGPELSSKNHEI